MYQTTIFDMILPKYKITKPIRLIEFFSGYGSQALALKYLGVKFEHWKTCEWAVKSIQAYKDIHFPGKHLTFNEERTKEEMVEYLYQKGISRNYNAPMTREQIQRINEKQLKNIMENIAITNNLVNIQQVKGKDLEIVDTDKYEYILTYSFPCQDLSLAGKGKGMSDTSTRSGMLWEVERILDECKELGTLPQILLMENVPQVHGEGNTNDFNKWQLKLEELGYSNYWEDLIATDYGIPQTRNRCFMVSILGEYSYSFPQKKELKLWLKDMLEEEVDDKYFLSDKMLAYCFGINQKESKYNRREVFERNLNPNKDVASTITTCAGNRATDNFIVSNKVLKETFEQNEIGENDVQYIDGFNRKIRKDNLANTITTRVSASSNDYILIKNATKKGYLKAQEGDGVDISSRMEYHRGTVQKGKTQTLTTMGGENNGVVIKPKVLTGFGKIGSTGQYHQQNRVYDDNVAISVTTAFNPYYLSDLAIRKLTPRECGRLMGVRDEDITNMLKNQSDSSAYHCFGDSIVVDVLMAIFGELL
jgi:DNA (cytosine-5)-methyltransferase 1